MNATSNSTTKRETAAPQKPNLSRAGRRVRAGAFTAPADDLGQKQRDAAATLRNVATSLAAELDRIAADEIRTPLEKRQAAAKATAAARAQVDAVQIKLHAAKTDVHDRIEQLEHLRRTVAAKVDPFTLRRLELQAAAIRAGGTDAVLQAWADAERTRDLERVLALQLVDPANAVQADRLFVRLARPEAFATLERDLQGLARVHQDVEAFGQGLGELEKASDPHMGDAPTSDDLFGIANAPRPAMDPTLPGWAREGVQ